MSLIVTSKPGQAHGSKSYASRAVLLWALGPLAACSAQEVVDASTARLRVDRPQLMIASGGTDLPSEDHPLTPVLTYASQGLEYICSEILDYSCVLIARERIDGRLGAYEYMQLKIRHERKSEDRVAAPFSVYVKYLAPAQLQGREVLYVKGHNDDALTVRRGGKRLPNMTLTLRPDGPLATEGRRYPVTDIGIENLVKKLIEVIENDVQYGECEVQVFRNAKLNQRVCTHIQVVHPVRRSHFTYHKATVFVDDELSLPIYFASYDWPKRPGDDPSLLEEYAYTQLKLNVGFSNLDFQRSNPSYGFLLPQEPGLPAQ